MDAKLTFSSLDKRLEAIPPGPAKVLDTPQWLAPWSALGTVGIVAGLMPSLLIKFMTPAMWMAHMAKIGVILSLIGYAPFFARTVWVLIGQFWRWRREFLSQLDHDFPQWGGIADELAKTPVDRLDAMQRFVRHADLRLSAKTRLLIGMDKLGIAPLLVAMAIQVKGYADDWATLPAWLGMLGMFAAVTYFIGFIASLMRLRLQLFDAYLTEALQRASGRKAEKGSENISV